MKPRVRFGGHRDPEGYHFEISGGAICLDLANTVDNRPADRRDLLGDFSDLLSWGVQAGALTDDEARRLRDRARGDRRGAAAALRRTRRLREAIFEIFSAVARQREPPRVRLDELTRALRHALTRRELRALGCAVVWSWTSEAECSFDLVCWRAARSAADVLASPEVSRVRECDGAGCRWLFLDTSRNGTRRWCDMTVCGNRAKARRFRARARVALSDGGICPGGPVGA